MNNRENALMALSGGVPESVPIYYASCQILIPSTMQDGPPFLQGPGYDGYGVHQTPTESAGGMFTPTTEMPPILTDINLWKEQVTFPTYDQFDWEESAIADKAFWRLDPENFVQDVFCPNGLFERLHFLMGFENALCSILMDPEPVYELVGKIADNKIEYIEKVGKYYKPDYFTFLDDYSHQDGLFISPETFRTIFKPHLKRIVEAVEANGMKFKMHCCGKMQDLFDDFYEIGIRSFDPVQPYNDIMMMKNKHPGKVGIVGGLDVQHVVDRTNATEEDIRKEIRRCIDSYAKGGGYMIYGASLHMYNPASYAPNGPLGIAIDEAMKYGHAYYVYQP